MEGLCRKTDNFDFELGFVVRVESAGGIVGDVSVFQKLIWAGKISVSFLQFQLKTDWGFSAV